METKDTISGLYNVTELSNDDGVCGTGSRNEQFLQAGENGLKTAYADYWEDSEVEWKSEDASVATVEAVNGGRSAIIHAMRPGTTTITVGVPGGVVTDRCTVTVGTDKPAEDVKCDDPELNIRDRSAIMVAHLM